jgi:hypothetical protein
MPDRAQEERPRRAYFVTEARKGETLWLVYANTAAEARKGYWRGEAIDAQDHPAGVRSVRRAPEDDLR